MWTDTQRATDDERPREKGEWYLLAGQTRRNYDIDFSSLAAAENLKNGTRGSRESLGIKIRKLSTSSLTDRVNQCARTRAGIVGSCCKVSVVATCGTTVGHVRRVWEGATSAGAVGVFGTVYSIP